MNRANSRSWESGNVSYKSGIINKSEEQRFQRLVFRISRGNAYAQFVPIEGIDSKEYPELA